MDQPKENLERKVVSEHNELSEAQFRAYQKALASVPVFSQQVIPKWVKREGTFAQVSALEQTAQAAVARIREDTGLSDVYLVIEPKLLQESQPVGHLVYGPTLKQGLSIDQYDHRLMLAAGAVSQTPVAFENKIFGTISVFTSSLTAEQEAYLKAIHPTIGVALRNANKFDQTRGLAYEESAAHAQTSRRLKEVMENSYAPLFKEKYVGNKEGKELTRAELDKWIADDKMPLVVEVSTYFEKSTAERILAEKISRARKEKKNLVLIYGDVDYFKYYNGKRDQGIPGYGHAQGDEALSAIGFAAFKHIRHPPIEAYREIGKVIEHLHTKPDHLDIAIRVGGEELAWVLEGVPIETGIQRAEQMVNSIRNLRVPRSPNIFTEELSYATHNGKPRSFRDVSMSVGVVGLEQIDDPALAPIDAAKRFIASGDNASMQAKAEGRDRVSVYKK